MTLFQNIDMKKLEQRFFIECASKKTDIVLLSAKDMFAWIAKNCQPNRQYLKPSPERIKELVSDYLDIPVIQMEGASRKMEIVQARHIAMTIIWHKCHLSLQSIGYLFGGRDHTSVIHARNAEFNQKTKRIYQHLLNLA